MQICYFGGYDRDHPRNGVMMSGLISCGVEVIECHSRHPVKAIRMLSLMVQYHRARNEVDLIFVGASCHAYVLIAWVLARLTGKPLIFDAFVSLFEAWLDEFPERRLYSLRGSYAYLLDKLSAFLSDVVLFDTEEHVAYFCETFGFSAEKVHAIQVGVRCDAFVPKPPKGSTPFKVLFAGSCLPLHGVDVIVQAAHLLKEEPGIVIELIVERNERSLIARSYESHNMIFREPVPYAEYAKLLTGADVALGAFGTTQKAGRVVPCKVYDALGAGVPLITADTPAIRRLLRHGQNAILVPPGDARALADAILLLKSHPSRRGRLALEGQRTCEKIGTHKVVGGKLISICKRAIESSTAGCVRGEGAR